jgi:hypothetical protein
VLLAAAPSDGGAMWVRVASKTRFDKPDVEQLKDLGKSQYADGNAHKRCLRYGKVAIITTEDPGLIGSDLHLAGDCDAEGTALTNNFFAGVRGPYLFTTGEPFGVLTWLTVFDLRTQAKVLEKEVATQPAFSLTEKEKGRWILKADLSLGRDCTRQNPAPCIPDAGLRPPHCEKAAAFPPPAKPDDVVQLTAPAELDLSHPDAPPQFQRGAMVGCATQP